MYNDTENAHRKALLFLAARLFEPLSKLFLRHSITVPTLEKVLRGSSIRVAANDPVFAVNRNDDKYRQTYSHAAVVTGLNRTQVSRVLQADTDLISTSRKTVNRLNSILKGWCNDPGYQTDDGKPVDLRLRGPRPSLHQLCMKYGRDTPTRPIADILIKNGNAEWIGESDDMSRGKTLRYRHSVVTAPSSSIEDIMILTQIGSDFAHSFEQAFDSNVEPTPRFREAYFDDIAVEHVAEALQFLNGEVQEFTSRCGNGLKRFRAFPDQTGVRLGVGAYTFQGAPLLLEEDGRTPHFTQSSWTTLDIEEKP